VQVINPGGFWMIPDSDRKHLDEMGEAYVRQVTKAGDGFPSPFRNSAIAWLAELDEKQRERDEAHQAEQMRIGRSTLKAAWIAVGAGIGAIVVTILSWLYPRH
jgi:hypothetical protein